MLGVFGIWALGLGSGIVCVVLLVWCLLRGFAGLCRGVWWVVLCCLLVCSLGFGCSGFFLVC